jgi:hypothetical protein
MGEFIICHIPVVPGEQDEEWRGRLAEFDQWCRRYCAADRYYTKVVLTDRLAGGVALVYEIGIADRSIAMLFKLTYA